MLSTSIIYLAMDAEEMVKPNGRPKVSRSLPWLLQYSWGVGDNSSRLAEKYIYKFTYSLPPPHCSHQSPTHSSCWSHSDQRELNQITYLSIPIDLTSKVARMLRYLSPNGRHIVVSNDLNEAMDLSQPTGVTVDSTQRTEQRRTKPYIGRPPNPRDFTLEMAEDVSIDSSASNHRSQWH